MFEKSDQYLSFIRKTNKENSEDFPDCLLVEQDGAALKAKVIESGDKCGYWDFISACEKRGSIVHCLFLNGRLFKTYFKDNFDIRSFTSKQLDYIYSHLKIKSIIKRDKKDEASFY